MVPERNVIPPHRFLSGIYIFPLVVFVKNTREEKEERDTSEIKEKVRMGFSSCLMLGKRPRKGDDDVSVGSNSQTKLFAMCCCVCRVQQVLWFR